MNEIDFRHADGVGHLVLTRPSRHNAVDSAMLAGLGQALDEAERLGSHLHCLLVTGAGASFCSGADLREIDGLDVAEARAFMLEAAWSFRRLERLEVPVVAAVHGYCLGGGFELALHCDLVIAADNATFGFPEAGIGLITTTGCIDRLIQVVGAMRAKELLLTGRRVPAEEAAHLGLLAQVVDPFELESAALARAQGFVRQSRHGLAATKAMFRERMNAGARASWIGEAEAFEQLFRLRRAEPRKEPT